SRIHGRKHSPGHAGRVHGQRQALAAAQLHARLQGPDPAAHRARTVAQRRFRQARRRHGAQDRRRLPVTLSSVRTLRREPLSRLGTTEMTLRDLTEGYTAFANGGVKVEPVLIRRIEDKDGKSFFTDEPRRREALSPETAALMTYILRGVVERGTATSIKALDRPVAGKTGTTNEQRDAWFIGYTPNLTVGVWVGFDDPNQTMGKMGTGGRVAAPIWLDFMKPALAGTPVRDFEMPEDINCVNIDPDSGKRAAEWTAAPFLECFKEGTEPGSPGEEDSTPPASPSEVRVYRPPGDAGSPPATGAGDPLGA